MFDLPDMSFERCWSFRDFGRLSAQDGPRNFQCGPTTAHEGLEMAQEASVTASTRPTKDQLGHDIAPRGPPERPETA
eukprot:8142362-Pyramimonas_sp.AAC.1